MDHGLKVASTNVLTAADKDCKFTSSASTLKIWKSGTLSYTTDGSGNGSASFTHSLGFAPAFYVWRTATARWDFMQNGVAHSNAWFPVGNVNKWVYETGNHQATMAYSNSTKIQVQTTGGSANTFHSFKYYILIDLAQAFTGSPSLSLTNDWGFAVSKDDKNVLTCKEYEKVYTSKYKALQYYDVNFKSTTLSLPAFWSSYSDPNPEAGTYVDINHGLGYAPFFLAFFNSNNFASENIFIEASNYFLNGSDQYSGEVSGFCDSTKVRLSLYRYGNYYPVKDNFLAETVTLKVYIFTENLGA